MVNSKKNGGGESSPRSSEASIQYSASTSGNLPHHVSPSSPTRGRKRVKFGVKSYLHHFYEDCAGIGLDEDEDDDYPMKSGQKRKCGILCKVGFSLSILLIVIGIVLLLVGFLVQTKPTKYVYENVAHVNKENVNFNKFLMYSRWIGAIAFCFGGVLLSICIVLFTFGKLNHKSELAERKLFEERLQGSSSAEDNYSYRGTDEYGNLVQYGTCGNTTTTTPTLTTSHPVPISLREVTPVQPSADSR